MTNSRKAKTFRDLEVWRDSIDLAVELYSRTSDFPTEEKYGLTSQIRRSTVSIASNIAEGNARGSLRDYIRFVGIARGSYAELETQILIAERLRFLTIGKDLREKLDRVSWKLRRLQEALKAKEQRERRE